MGLLHALHCRPTAVADLIPGDMVVNACIATAWKTAKDSPKVRFLGLYFSLFSSVIKTGFTNTLLPNTTKFVPISEGRAQREGVFFLNQSLGDCKKLAQGTILGRLLLILS